MLSVFFFPKVITLSEFHCILVLLLCLSFPQNDEMMVSNKIYFQHAANPVHWFPWGKEAFEVNQHVAKLFPSNSKSINCFG